jgi:hypothetical protein
MTEPREEDVVEEVRLCVEEDKRREGNGHASSCGSLDEWDAGDEPGPIPPRQWLLSNQFCRTFISSVVAAGGCGKTALRLLQFISLAIGRSLCGQHVFRRCRVLLISLEDDRDELQRRIKAVLDRYNIDRAELNIVSLDPFIKTHGLAENDNADMDFVCDLLARMAVEFNIAVDSPHHVHKGQIVPGDADSGRGASGIKDAGRLVYTLCPMSEDEARAFNIGPEDRRSYVRLDSAKVNIAAHSAKATWFRIVGEPLGNATAEYPNGDTVQVVEPWAPPDTWAGLSSETLNRVLSEIDRGMANEDGAPTGRRYSSAPSAKGDRAAWRVVNRFCPDRSEAQCREIIRTWEDNGLLVSREYEDPSHRRSEGGLFVDNVKRPGTAQ